MIAGQRVETKGGPQAWKEAISILINQEALPPLQWNDGLYLAARVHCIDAGTSGFPGHMGSDASYPEQRLRRYGSFKGNPGENLVLGANLSPIDIVMKMFMDDSDEKKRARKFLLTKNFKSTGMYVCKHNSEFKQLVTVVYAQSQFKLNKKAKEEVAILRAAKLKELYQSLILYENLHSSMTSSTIVPVVIGTLVLVIVIVSIVVFYSKYQIKEESGSSKIRSETLKEPGVFIAGGPLIKASKRSLFDHLQNVSIDKDQSMGDIPDDFNFNPKSFDGSSLSRTVNI